MLRTRVIPVLLLRDGGLVKTIKFKKERYLGDPINAVKIFNQKEADELVLLDIGARKSGNGPNIEEIREIVSEAFMPIGYGGGISTISHIESLFKVGVEKVILNTAAFENGKLIEQASKIFGSQSIVVSIDVKRDLWGKQKIYTNSGSKKQTVDFVSAIKSLQDLGCGEIIINSIDRDGTMEGYDLELIKKATSVLDIPVVALGGAGSIKDLSEAVNIGASGVAAGSLFVFQGVHRAVLISYITSEQLHNQL
ncbi:AglZ/HisF2 family acetamidino modification protein [Cecembia rubra]|uniref:imidazole glycerol-phosphate synthase n=1 Tax=Cecembia rubra TaxID=1485585 RepID=A0A2P8EA35_9BACT|nr:AglZ/HisF2 family acetamidino modification protein [Cecembia rubra]PSL06320.1 cyclase [Cecembia rubra]